MGALDMGWFTQVGKRKSQLAGTKKSGWVGRRLPPSRAVPGGSAGAFALPPRLRIPAPAVSPDRRSCEDGCKFS